MFISQLAPPDKRFRALMRAKGKLLAESNPAEIRIGAVFK
jgi:hypothetical protein